MWFPAAFGVSPDADKGRRISLRWWLIALLLLSYWRPALAQGLAVLELRFGEDVPPALADTVRQRIRYSLTARGYRVIAEEDVRRRLREATPAGCVVGPCLAQVGRTLNAQRALLGAVAAHGSSFELTLTLLETGGGTVLAQAHQRCDVCNFREMEGVAAQAAARLHRRALTALALRSDLTVTTVPPASEVVVDGLPHGPAPVKALLPPGRHTIEAMAHNLPPLRRELELRAGAARTLAVNLAEHRDELRPSRGPSRRGYPTWLKWAAFSGGAALLGPGAVLWAVDGRPAADGRTVHETRGAGIALVCAGGAAVVGGAVLWLLER